ncbi:hypothetical protein BJY00DRAFT_319327 [Aspergillus carlsbadensis]|nr:hypothetical protein BJY00DRAFT_319327 [Aspergillus carlsbadensis]
MSDTRPRKRRKRSSTASLVPFESISPEPLPRESAHRQTTANESTIHDPISREPISPRPIPFESISGTPIVRKHSPEPASASPWAPTHVHTIGPHTPRIELEYPPSKMTLTYDDKYLAVIVGGKEICLYDTSNFELFSTLQVPESGPKYKEVRFAPLLMENEAYMLVTVTNKIEIYDFNPELQVPIPGVHAPLGDVEPQGPSAGSTADGLGERHGGLEARITFPNSTRLCIPERQFTIRGQYVKFSYDGTFMVCRTGPRIRILDVKERRVQKVVNPENRRATVTISPDSRLLATCGTPGPLRIWEASNSYGGSVFELAGKEKVEKVIFSPNSKWLAVQYPQGEELHKIYDIATGQIIFTLNNSYRLGAWSIGGNLLAACSVTIPRNIILVDGSTGVERVRWNFGQEEGQKSTPKKNRQNCLRSASSYQPRFLGHGAKLVFCSADGGLDLYDFLSLAVHRYSGWHGSNYLTFFNNARGFIMSDYENRALIFQDFK